ncbi:GFA family protein [Amorphus coralli]|uniref:GFA family protein n=1 Tax=Amorphus coralli TaxID=340680 RepID=UPI00036C8E39|nr:GFA family protein [Amorphus coralli]
MRDAFEAVVGTCRCGRTRFEMSAPPLMTAACHCRGCQKMSASAFSLTAMVPADAFKVLEGDPVPAGVQGNGLAHFCCSHCKSWMFTRIDGVEAFVNVRPALFDDPAWCTPFMETMTSERLPWAQTPASHSYEGFPSMEELPGLIQAFADHLQANGGVP